LFEKGIFKIFVERESVDLVIARIAASLGSWVGKNIRFASV
jgi:hypothetical protein